MTRWAWALAGAALLAGLAGLVAARALGRSGSRPAAMLSVVTGWLGAWVVWGFLGTLAVGGGAGPPAHATHSGAVGRARGAGPCPTQQAQRPGRRVVVFVGGQLVWLGVVLLQNGVLGR